MPTPRNTIAPHPLEAENRQDKAERIVAFLDRHMPNVTSTALRFLSDEDWLKINRLMEEPRPPSKATVSAVIALVKGRETALEAVRRAVGAR